MCVTAKAAVAVLKIWVLYFQQFMFPKSIFFAFYITSHFLAWEPFGTGWQSKTLYIVITTKAEHLQFVLHRHTLPNYPSAERILVWLLPQS